MRCESVDELAAAYAVGAVDRDEDRAISEHLDSCAEPHAEARELIGAGGLLSAGLEPVQPSAALRDRLMQSVAVTAQDHRVVRRNAAPKIAPTFLDRWRRVALPLAAAAAAVAIGLGALAVTSQREVAERDEVLRMVAAATDAYQVTGEAGSGWLLQTESGAVFVAAELAALDAGRIYELWLIEPDGSPVAVGDVTDADGVVAVQLERPISDATTFAVTVETERVEAPTTDPILTAALDG